MRDMFIGIIIGLLLFSGAYFYFRANRPAQQEISFTVQLPAETKAKPVKVTPSKPISKDSSGYWRHKYDSVHAIIAGIDTTQSIDAAMLNYVLPEQAEIEDSISIDFLTIYPMNPMGSRISHDSTHYKPFHCDTTIAPTNPEKDKDIGVTTVGCVGVGAAGGAAIWNIPGAALGAVAGLLADWIFF